ncbi:MAG: hypothetical protein HC905_23135 [Bacteroidales bacterium]|nr:hypothetical protein [Bacteroidales bacterium]
MVNSIRPYCLKKTSLTYLFCITLATGFIAGCKSITNNNITDTTQADSISGSKNILANDSLTEDQETELILKQKHIDDSIAYASLKDYDGEYLIQTESEGVDAKLTLMYKNDRTFEYIYTFRVNSEEADCNGETKGIIMMDRTQHGFDRQGECMIHFNFNGYWNGHYVVEIDFEDQAKCTFLKGECNFAGTFLKK